METIIVRVGPELLEALKALGAANIGEATRVALEAWLRILVPMMAPRPGAAPAKRRPKTK